MKQHIHVGDYIEHTMPFSEVCMHMKIADKKMRVRVLPTMAQVYTLDNQKFSFPITHGEAGIFEDEKGLYVYPPAIVLYPGVG